jgi:hypothetical protein
MMPATTRALAADESHRPGLRIVATVTRCQTRRP